MPARLRQPFVYKSIEVVYKSSVAQSKCYKDVGLKNFCAPLLIGFSFVTLVGCQSTPPTGDEPSRDTSTHAQAAQQHGQAEPTSTQHQANLPAAQDNLPTFTNDLWRNETLQVDSQISALANQISITRFYYDDKYVDRINLTSGILFDVDKDRLNRRAQIVVSTIIQSFSEQLSSQHVYVIGHTDSDGSASYNMGLSLRRANSVLQAMRSQQVPTERLSVVAAGEHVPVVANTTDENKAINRRVEIYVSPWRDAPLALLRDWKCPDSVCDTVDLDILSVDRNYSIGQQQRSTGTQRTVRPMTRNVSARQVWAIDEERPAPTSFSQMRTAPQQRTIRSLQTIQSTRTLRILDARYQVSHRDPDYQQLIERLKARGY